MDLELNHGLLNQPTPDRHGFWFKRDLENINLGDPVARDFTDMHPVSTIVDPEANEKLQRIKNQDLTEAVITCLSIIVFP